MLAAPPVLVLPQAISTSFPKKHTSDRLNPARLERRRTELQALFNLLIDFVRWLPPPWTD